MKILLVAVNAKYTHMNPALYSIRAYAREYSRIFEIAEYTINQYPKDVLTDIYERHPDVIGFSCYIWNMDFISRLLADVGKILPDVPVYLGGPEVSYNAGAVLARYPSVHGVICGEGETVWKEIAAQLAEEGPAARSVPGLMTRTDHPALPAPLPLDDIPFIYDDLAPFAHKILYYETSRGCPYRCSYCISSIEKGLRSRSLAMVFPELQFFLDHNVRIVKFIDRTFNADHAHAMGIWKYLKEHDNGVTRFHFEIEADILTEEEISFLSTVRPGQFQLEVGVQSIHGQTLRAVDRFADTSKIKNAVLRILAAGNIPVHVDLIAGLPYEDLALFEASFNEVCSWGAGELQLGFLKVLHGTAMEAKAQEYGLVYETDTPYEVLSTKWLSYGDLILLKRIEEQLERYANSGSFRHTLPAFARLFDTPFAMFLFLSEYYQQHAGRFSRQSRVSAYEMLRSAIAGRLEEIGSSLLPSHFDALLLLDLYEKEKLRSRPLFFGGEKVRREKERRILRAFPPTDTIHAEFFSFDVREFERTGTVVPAPQAVIFHYHGQGAAVDVTYEEFE